jgi:hypothetical protein
LATAIETYLEQKSGKSLKTIAPAQDCDRAGTRPEHPQLKVVAMVRRTAFGELCRELFGNEPNPEENHHF